MPPPSVAKRSRYVPAHVAREVWKRDEGKCRWPVEGGGECGATVRVQLDHIDGWALGGATTVDRMRLLCAFHQDIHARRLYGGALMDRHTKPKGGGCSEPVAEYAANCGPSSCEPRAAAAVMPRAPAG